MFNVLKKMRIIEGASFVAAPSCCLHLAQLGAEVIRFDMIGGGPDFNRWPIAANGASFYWEGLNKGKKSIAIDLGRPEGRELAVQLITSSDPDGGMFVTNFPAEGFLSHKALSAKRADLITVRVMGWADGATALDYTVNAAAGYPLITGPVDSERPVNHVLPAWDLVTGAYAAFALLAAERHRRDSGLGQEVRVPLGDMAIASVGHLGQIAEAVAGYDRPRFGNDLFGAFGRDFKTADGSIIIVAITTRQWSGLLASLGVGDAIAALEQELGVSFATSEVVRFQHRARLFPIIEAATSKRAIADLAEPFNRSGVCWDRYQTVKQAVASDPRYTTNPLLSEIAQPSGHSYRAPGSVANFTGQDRQIPVRAPKLGEHTEEVLANLLRMSEAEIGRLHDQKIVASAR